MQPWVCFCRKSISWEHLNGGWDNKTHSIAKQGFSRIKWTFDAMNCLICVSCSTGRLLGSFRYGNFPGWLAPVRKSSVRNGVDYIPRKCMPQEFKIWLKFCAKAPKNKRQPGRKVNLAQPLDVVVDDIWSLYVCSSCAAFFVNIIRSLQRFRSSIRKVC